MRLRSQDNANSAGHQNTSTPRQAQPPAVVSSPYQTAYNRGAVPGPDGQFDHFVRTLNETHMQTGYWRFSSNEDERRAYDRGFSTPEDILIAQDRSDESYDDISLRWVRGADDTNMRLPTVGPAAQHLETIYEIRQVLGMPMSLRGQIPVYPISQDVRLRQYWDEKARQQSMPFDPPPTTSQMPRSSISNTESFSSADSQIGAGSRSSSSITRHENNPAGHRRRTQGAPAASEGVHSSSRPRRPTASPLTPERVPEPVPTPADMNLTSLSLRDYPLNANARQYNSPSIGLALPSGTSSGRSTIGINAPYTPPIGISSVSRPPSPYEPPASLPLPPQQAGNADRTSPRKPQLHPPNGLALPAQPSQRSIVSTDPRLARPGNNTTSAPSPLVALKHTTNKPHNIRPTTSISNAETSEIDQSIQQKSSVEVTPVVASNDLSTDGLVQRGQPTRDAPPASPDELDDTTEPGQTYHEDETPMSSDSLASKGKQDPPHESEMYPGLPCMDCGEIDGHKWDCHIGNLTPMKHFTVLDYRTLADAVKRMDPGPRTTHFDQFPEPQPEDPETQVKGMAEIIRNEESYKNDTDLHGLPDDAMIVLWAFKTSFGVDVFKE